MDYFGWLCMIGMPDERKRSRYIFLLKLLMNTEFRWILPRDENRSEDGLELRSIFEDETGEGCYYDGPCSVLEMLIALSIRCDQELMYDPEDENRADRWFWMMLENLDLTKFVDKSFDEKAVLWILSQWMDRNYSQSGCFCLFPIPKIATKFRRMELWNQLNWYLNWRFGDEFG